MECDPHLEFNLKSKWLELILENWRNGELGNLLLPYAVADSGFPVGAHGPIRGAWTPDMGTLWQNVCKNERIGSRGGGGVHPACPLDPPMLCGIVNALIT